MCKMCKRREATKRMTRKDERDLAGTITKLALCFSLSITGRDSSLTHDYPPSAVSAR